MNSGIPLPDHRGRVRRPDSAVPAVDRRNPLIEVAPSSEPRDLVEAQLDRVMPQAALEPEQLHRAMRHAVFSGGKRIRPQLLLTVFNACRPRRREREGDLALQAACAIELIHTASLVHDDLPTFDDASERRGRPTVHTLFGEPIALLVGDALLARAFEMMAETPPGLATRALRIVRLLGLRTGSRHGIIGGQSLEDLAWPERQLVARYHEMKTGSLFQLAAEAGAAAAGVTDTSGWCRVGQNIGLAYQLADDLYDVYGKKAIEGKPVGRDAALGRPNAALLDGAEATKERLRELLREASREANRLAVDPAPVRAMFRELEARIRNLME